MKIIFEDAESVEDVQEYFDDRDDAIRSRAILRDFRKWIRGLLKYRDNHRNVDRVLNVVWSKLHKIASENDIDLGSI